MQRTVPPPHNPSRITQRLARSTRIPLRRRLRFAYRSVATWFGRVIAAEGRAAPTQDPFRQIALEASEREAAIDASVGAMSAADIRRIVNRPG